MMNFMQQPQQQPPVISPGLQALMALQQAVQTGQVAPQTPQGQPTVAAQLAQAAQQQLRPPQQPPQMPGMQNAAQNAGIAGGINAQKQQQLQQVMAQMAAQKMAQQAQQGPLDLNSGIAAGAPSPQMAEGGIVGFADGDYVPGEPGMLEQFLTAIAAKAKNVFTPQNQGRGVVNPPNVVPDTTIVAPPTVTVNTGQPGPDVSNRLAILQQELAQAMAKNNPADIAALQRQIAEEKAGVPIPDTQAFGSDGGAARAGAPAASGIAGLPAGMRNPAVINRENVPAVYAATPSPEEAFNAAKTANAQTVMPPVYTPEQNKTKKDEQRALYGLPAVVGQNELDYIAQQKAANDALAAKQQANVARRPMDNLIAMLTTPGQNMPQKLAAGATNVLGIEKGQRAEDIEFSNLLSQRAAALNNVQMSVDNLREALATGDVDKAQALMEALRQAQNTKTAIDAGIEEKRAQSRTQTAVPQIAAQASLEAHRMTGEDALNRAIEMANARAVTADKGWADWVNDNVQKALDSVLKNPMLAIQYDTPEKIDALRETLYQKALDKARQDPRWADKIPANTATTTGKKTVKWGDIKQ
jgi:hypothetical protein